VGEIVVASSRSAPNTPGKFQLYASNGPNLAQLTKLTAGHDLGQRSGVFARWLAHRVRFAARRQRRDLRHGMRRTGSTRLTNDPQPDGRPAFTPDGSRVFHSARTAGKQQIWVVNLDARRSPADRATR